MAKIDPGKKNVISRLNRIGGQISGVKNMIESGRACDDIIIQMAAIRAAVGQLSAMMVQEHMEECIKGAIAKGNSKELVSSLNKVMKQMLK